jgi:glutathione S-transferase
MITLYTFGPALGLRDPSPFVAKADLLLKMSGQPYRSVRGALTKAPKGKLPYIDDDGLVIADSTFIRFHLEDRYGLDFDAGLSPAERAVAWSIEKMCEDHFYWLLVFERWMDDRNFAAGPAQFFRGLPAVLRPVVQGLIRGKLRRALTAQGTARHTPEEQGRLAERDLQAIRAVVGTRRFLMGETPCGADATVYGFLAGALCPLFDGPVHRAARSFPDLADYCARIEAQFYRT